MNTSAIHWCGTPIGDVDAPELGLPEGVWPDTLDIDGVPFSKNKTKLGSDGIVYVRYQGADARVLLVFADLDSPDGDS